MQCSKQRRYYAPLGCNIQGCNNVLFDRKLTQFKRKDATPIFGRIIFLRRCIAKAQGSSSRKTTILTFADVKTSNVNLELNIFIKIFMFLKNLIFSCCFYIYSNFIVTPDKFTKEQTLIEMSMIKYKRENLIYFK